MASLARNRRGSTDEVSPSYRARQAETVPLAWAAKSLLMNGNFPGVDFVGGRNHWNRDGTAGCKSCFADLHYGNC